MPEARRSGAGAFKSLLDQGLCRLAEAGVARVLSIWRNMGRVLASRIAAVALLAAITVGVDAREARADEAVLPSGDRLVWDGGLRAGADRIRAALPGIRATVERRLGRLRPTGTTRIHLVSGWERMRAVAGEGVPEWAAGVQVASRNLIAIRIDLADQRPGNRLEHVLRHEWVHFIWSRASGAHRRNLPLWLEEGLAEWIGGGISVDAGGQLDLAAAFDNLLGFDGIANTWPKNRYEAALAYAQSKDWVHFFRAHPRGGEDVLQAMLRDLAAGKPAKPTVHGSPIETVVWRHTQRPLSLWIQDWRVQVKETASPWLALFRDLWTTMFLVIGVVGGIAFFFIRRRRKRQIERMPDGDFPPGYQGS